MNKKRTFLHLSDVVLSNWCLWVSCPLSFYVGHFVLYNSPKKLNNGHVTMNWICTIVCIFHGWLMAGVLLKVLLFSRYIPVSLRQNYIQFAVIGNVVLVTYYIITWFIILFWLQFFDLVVVRLLGTLPPQKSYTSLSDVSYLSTNGRSARVIENNSFLQSRKGFYVSILSPFYR